MGVVFGLFSGFYYWIEYLLGLKYSSFLGRLHFYLTFVGVNLTFFPMHFLGLAGMPRRIPDYPDIYWTWNYYSSVGSFISVIGLFVFFYLVLNMMNLNVINLQKNNILYILIKSNNNQNLLLKFKKLEYLLNKLIYKFFNKKFYIFNKYNFHNFFDKSNFYSVIDKFYFSYYIYYIINIWNITVENKLCALINLYSYNYNLIYCYYLNFSKLIVNNLINIKFKFIIINIFLKNYINNIYIYIIIYLYKKQLFKNYIKN